MVGAAIGAASMGAFVVGAAIGAASVGAFVVGAAIGAASVGAFVVGAAIGAASVGAFVVGAASFLLSMPSEPGKFRGSKSIFSYYALTKAISRCR